MPTPSLAGSGWRGRSVCAAPVLIGGLARCVAPTGLKLNGLAVPVTEYWRYETLLFILHWPGLAWHQTYSCGVIYCPSAKYVAPGFCVVLRSAISVKMRCDGP